jgi:hypothetical protein
MTTGKLTMAVSEVMTPCDAVGGYRCLWETYRLRIQGEGNNIKINLREI